MLPLPITPHRGPSFSELERRVKIWSQPLFKRTKSESEPLAPKARWVWFSQVRGYGSAESYGPFVHKWTPVSQLRLLDISNEDRSDIARLCAVPEQDLSCDEQYGGGSLNVDFHDTILNALLALQLDGTFASEESSEESSDDVCGVSEIVLIRQSVETKLRHLGVVEVM